MGDLAKHTAGPWVIDELRTQCGRAFRIGASEMLKSGKGCCIIYDDYPGNPHNERAANARLIAAAPDLLAALRGLVKVNEIIGKTLNWKDDYLEVARAALAAATGANHEQ